MVKTIIYNFSILIRFLTTRRTDVAASFNPTSNSLSATAIGPIFYYKFCVFHKSLGIAVVLSQITRFKNHLFVLHAQTCILQKEYTNKFMCIISLSKCKTISKQLSDKLPHEVSERYLHKKIIGNLKVAG